MSISAIGPSPRMFGDVSSASSGTAQPLGPASPAEEFLKFARMTPGERLRAAILKELGITEEELESMDPAAREAVEKQIAEKLKDKLQEATEQKTGMIVDVQA